MTAPLASVRAVCLKRDGWRCVSCGSRGSLEMNHRQTVGMGGSRVRPGPVDLVSSCPRCNMEYEGTLELEALVYGWKVRRWVVDVARVPVFCAWIDLWGMLTPAGGIEVLDRRGVFSAMREVYGSEWDRWVDRLEEPIGLRGR